MKQMRCVPDLRRFSAQPGTLLVWEGICETLYRFYRLRIGIEREEQEAQDWIIVARSTDDGTSDLFTFSAMASTAKNSLKKLLSTHEWDVHHNGFGFPTFIYTSVDDQNRYYPSDTEKVKGIEFRPLVIYRGTSRLIRVPFELDQKFLLYHDAAFVPERSEYQRINENGDTVTVARLRDAGNAIEFLIDAHHLKDYLAANQSYLVRYHDHRRKSTQNVDAQITEEMRKRTFQGSNYRYNVYIDPRGREAYTMSVLNGKDIVLPYSKPDGRYLGKAERRYANFIIRRNPQGQEIESTCGTDYNPPAGVAPFLTPVFFEKGVLNKYYLEPSRYEVDATSVRGKGVFHIDIDLTEEGLVMVWLGDLGRIPYKEQMHWRQYNVAPRGTMTENRFRRDILGEWIEPELDAAQQFRHTFEQVQQITCEAYGEPLFKELSEADRHALDALHLPVTDEQREFDEQVQALAKVTCDSLNVKLMIRETGKKIEKDGEIKGSIDLLAVFLEHIGADEETVKQVTGDLKIVQTLRSSGSAHRKGEDYDKNLRKFGLDSLSHREKFARLAMGGGAACAAIGEIVTKSQVETRIEISTNHQEDV